MLRDFPHIAVLGEERSRFFPAEYLVLVDPIDGTIPYTYGCGSSAFMITLLRNGAPILGVIYGFITEHLWWAEVGQGAFLNGKRIRVSDNKVLMRQPGKRSPAVWLGTWKDAGWNLEELYAPLVRLGVHVTTEYTLGYYGGLLASGQVHATLFPGHAAWETAAMDIVVREAGGVICDLNGKPMTYNLVEDCSPQNRMIQGHVVANCPEIRDDLLGMIWQIPGNVMGTAA